MFLRLYFAQWLGNSLWWTAREPLISNPFYRLIEFHSNQLKLENELLGMPAAPFIPPHWAKPTKWEAAAGFGSLKAGLVLTAKDWWREGFTSAKAQANFLAWSVFDQLDAGCSWKKVEQIYLRHWICLEGQNLGNLQIEFETHLISTLFKKLFRLASGEAIGATKMLHV